MSIKKVLKVLVDFIISMDNVTTQKPAAVVGPPLWADYGRPRKAGVRITRSDEMETADFIGKGEPLFRRQGLVMNPDQRSEFI